MSLRPQHPGSIIAETILSPRKLSLSAAARKMGVSKQALANLIGQKSNLTAEMAVRFEKFFSENAENLLMRQMAYDLYLARSKIYIGLPDDLVHYEYDLFHKS